MSDPFLDDAAVRRLTGYAHKSKQIEQLRRMGVPFNINGCGKPVVARTAIEGSTAPKKEKVKKSWEPNVLAT